MTYKTRPGIELLHICGVHMLVGTRATWDVCPHVTQLPKGAAMSWSLLAKGHSPKAVAGTLAFFSHQPLAKAEESLAQFIEKMVEKGYLIEEHHDE